MHDISTIAKLNAQAVEKSIENFRGQGRYVIATYTGLHIQSVETFSDQDSALRVFETLKPSSPDVHYKLFAPNPNLVGDHDQSEDR